MINPLDLPGPQFLQPYLLLLVAARSAAAMILRWALRLPADEPVGEDVRLGPYEVAYLAGGEQLAANAAIASLVQRRVLAVDPAGRKLIAQKPLPPKARIRWRRPLRPARRSRSAPSSRPGRPRRGAGRDPRTPDRARHGRRGWAGVGHPVRLLGGGPGRAGAWG